MLVEYKLKNNAFSYVFEANLIYEDCNNICLSNPEVITQLSKKDLDYITIKGEE